jgi:cytoskeletal protein RodZ
MNVISQILQLILGIFLALSILVGGGVATALYFINRTSAPPPKPIYSNDKPEVKAQASKDNPETNKEAQAKPSPSPKPTPSVSPKAEESPKPLPPGAYYATVTWPQGLIVRGEPSLNSQQISGVGYNTKVIVLQDSDDKAWQKIRVEGSEQEGWVKAGNTKKVDE